MAVSDEDLDEAGAYVARLLTALVWSLPDDDEDAMVEIGPHHPTGCSPFARKR